MRHIFLSCVTCLCFALSARGQIDPKMLMDISSTEFISGGSIPKEYTCEGSNISPPLNISRTPDAAKSLVLLVDDIDAPRGKFVHWLVWNIEPKTESISKGTVPNGAVQGKNDFGKDGYGGPCPPSG